MDPLRQDSKSTCALQPGPETVGAIAAGTMVILLHFSASSLWVPVSPQDLCKGCYE